MRVWPHAVIANRPELRQKPRVAAPSSVRPSRRAWKTRRWTRRWRRRACRRTHAAVPLRQPMVYRVEVRRASTPSSEKESLRRFSTVESSCRTCSRGDARSTTSPLDLHGHPRAAEIPGRLETLLAQCASTPNCDSNRVPLPTMRCSKARPTPSPAVANRLEARPCGDGPELLKSELWSQCDSMMPSPTARLPSAGGTRRVRPLVAGAASDVLERASATARSALPCAGVLGAA